MKFRLGPIPNSLSDTELASGAWTPLWQPPFWAFQLIALLAGALGASVVLCVWVVFGPSFPPELSGDWYLGAICAAVLVGGMALQLIAHPGYGLTAQSALGLWPSRLTLYTYFDGAVSKARLLLSLLLPAAVLVVLPLGASLLHTRFSGWLAFFAGVGAFAFGLWPMMAVYAAIQVPAQAQVAARGLQLFWRRPIN